LKRGSRTGFVLAARISGLLLPLTVLMWLAPILPRFPSGLVKFHVVNLSGEQVFVTPLGVSGKSASRITLPLYKIGKFPEREEIIERIPLEPNEERFLMYDLDYVQFSEVLVEPVSGPPRVMIANPAPFERQNSAPPIREFRIPNLDRLGFGSADHLAFRSVWWWRRVRALPGIVFLYFLKVVVPVMFVVSLVRKRKLNDLVRTEDVEVSRYSDER